MIHYLYISRTYATLTTMRIHVLNAGINRLSSYTLNGYEENKAMGSTTFNEMYDWKDDIIYSLSENIILFQTTDEKQFKEYLTQYRAIEKL